MPDANSFFGSQPTFHVDGQEDAVLATQLIALVITETVGGPPRCEATFNNLVAGALAYPDGRSLALARPLEIRVGDELLFIGHVVALEGRFPAAWPPELRAIATGETSDGHAHATTLQLVHGAGLRELYVTVEGGAETGADPTTARGVAVPTRGLRVGVRAQLEGVGPSFGGEFQVTETRHIYDLSHGLRTEFVAMRAP